MKRIFVLLISMLILAACQSEVELEIMSQGIVNEEVIMNESYSIYIPIATNVAISSMEITSLYGEDVDEIDYSVEYDLENVSETKGSYVYGIMLDVDVEEYEKDLIINSADIKLDGVTYDYDIGEIKLKNDSNVNRNLETFYFEGGPITMYEYDSPLLWDFNVEEDILITKVYLTNSNLLIEDL